MSNTHPWHLPVTSHLDVVKEELHRIEQKRLAQFPIRVQKVKRLRRQITELNRALRREKRISKESWELMERMIGVCDTNTDTINKMFKTHDDAVTIGEGFEKLYRSANSRAETWQRRTGMMGVVGLITGLVVGVVGTLVLTSL